MFKQSLVLLYQVEDPETIEIVKNSVSSGSEVKQETSTHHDSKVEDKVQKVSFTKISPSAKILISEYGLDTSSLTASGPHGTLLKGDVLNAIKSGKASPKSSPAKKTSPSHQSIPQTLGVGSESELQQSDSFKDLPNTQIRKVGIIKRICFKLIAELADF